MTTLLEVAPELVQDVEGVIVRLGRSGLVEQLRAAPIVSWTFDEFAQAAYVYISPRSRDVVEETLSLYDDIGVNLDLDKDGRLVGIELFGYEDALARIRENCAESAQ